MIANSAILPGHDPTHLPSVTNPGSDTGRLHRGNRLFRLSWSDIRTPCLWIAFGGKDR